MEFFKRLLADYKEDKTLEAELEKGLVDPEFLDRATALIWGGRNGRALLG